MTAHRGSMCLSLLLAAAISTSAVAAPPKRDSTPARPPAVAASESNRGDDPAGPIERLLRKVKRLIAGSLDIPVVPQP